MGDEKQKRDSGSGDEEDNELALALVAECHYGGKKYKAGESWHDEADKCRLNICNPGGIVSFLECPTFDVAENDEDYVRVPGNDKYAYPNCCDYVFRTKKVKEKENEKKNEVEKNTEQEHEKGNKKEVESGKERKKAKDKKKDKEKLKKKEKEKDKDKKEQEQKEKKNENEKENENLKETISSD